MSTRNQRRRKAKAKALRIASEKAKAERKHNALEKRRQSPLTAEEERAWRKVRSSTAEVLDYCYRASDRNFAHRSLRGKVVQGKFVPAR